MYTRIFEAAENFARFHGKTYRGVYLFLIILMNIVLMIIIVIIIIIIIPQKKSTLSPIVIRLAMLEETAYLKLMEVYKAHDEGLIKGQKIKLDKTRRDLKPHIFSGLVQVKHMPSQADLLRELVDGHTTLGTFKQECAQVAKRQAAQSLFMKAVNVKTWEQASLDYPSHCTSKAVDRFRGVDLRRSTPVTWADHVQSAKRFKQGESKS